MLDVVYVHKEKNTGEIELSIKSLKNLEHRNIYIIGDDPKLNLDYIHIPHEKHSWAIESQHADQMSKYLQACNIEGLSDNFVAMNDDFFIMKQWQPVYYNQGTLLEHFARRGIRDTYGQSLQDTARYLRHKKKGVLDFELHTPFVFNKGKLKEMIEHLNNHKLQVRSLYGNIYELESQFSTDVKYVVDYQGKPLISTSKATFNGEIGAYIKEQLA